MIKYDNDYLLSLFDIREQSAQEATRARPRPRPRATSTTTSTRRKKP